MEKSYARRTVLALIYLEYLFTGYTLEECIFDINYNLYRCDVDKWVI